MLRVNCSQLPDICNLWTGVVSCLRYRFVWTRKASLHLPLSLMASLCVSLRPHRPEQEDHRVPDDRRHRPRQLRLRDAGGGRHARGVWLGNVLQTDPHPDRAAEQRPQRTLRVSAIIFDTFDIISRLSHCAMSAHICDTSWPRVSWIPQLSVLASHCFESTGLKTLIIHWRGLPLALHCFYTRTNLLLDLGVAWDRQRQRCSLWLIVFKALDYICVPAVSQTMHFFSPSVQFIQICSFWNGRSWKPP